MTDSQVHYDKMTDSEKKKEDWMNAKWRPMMGWMYMFVCLFDFVIAPIGWTSIQAFFHGGINTQWQPLTLQGGGLFHVAMGAVIGISAYGRTKEKLEGVAGNNQPMGTQYVPPGGMQGNMGMNNGMSGMNSNMGGFGGMSNGIGMNNNMSSSMNGGFGSSSMPTTSGFGSAPLGGNSISTAAPTISPAPVSNPTSSKSAVPTSGFPPL